MSDETIIVKNQGTIFLGGPPLVKAAIGEIVSAEDLGGGDVHTRLSGVADHLADNDAHALALARLAVARLNHRKTLHAAVVPAKAPLYDPKEIYGVIPVDTRKPYDVRDIIARIEELEQEQPDDDAARDWTGSQELADLTALMSELEGMGGDEQWRGDWYPVTLIRDNYFQTYAQELAEDIGAVKADAQWPHTCIDWEHAARELRYDYSGVDIAGVTYWTR
jgi:hypothetical protein